MLHPKQHIADLAEICNKRDISRVVISPGSRSAPLIKAFVQTFGDRCVSIVDERSAAYYALGIALQTQQPVVLICTSGTAVLNYAPALAEAFYQKVPLLAITADRPHEWIDQQDNQTLRQKDIYQNYIRASFELPQIITTPDDLWYAHRMINEAVNVCISQNKGPVHINVPLTDPLYEDLPLPSQKILVIPRELSDMEFKLPADMVLDWENARRIMILHGQDIPDSRNAQILPALLKDERVVILAENIANIQDSLVLSNSNVVLSNARGNNPHYPDLILHSGGQVVSKALTAYLRRAPAIKCWRIGTDQGIIDTFRQTSRLLPYPASWVYQALADAKPVKSDTDYRSDWLRLVSETGKLVERALTQLPFCDAQVFSMIHHAIPEGTVVSLGNSSVIRYSQFFPARRGISYYANRGVSGIDGSLSTAAGIAHASDKVVIAMVGDLGFLYDSNALWNNALPRNLRILVINNQGGGIFHILKGPLEQPGFKKVIEAHHPVNIHKLAEAYGLGYLFADSVSTLSKVWEEFISTPDHPIILEVKTDAATSASCFRKLMNSAG